MDSLETLNAHLVTLYPKITPSEKKIAHFIKRHSTEVVFYNIVSLSKKIGISPATVSKFVKALGLSGFKELQKIYKKELVRSSVEGGFSEKHHVFDLNSSNLTTKQVIDSVIHYDIHALRTLNSQINVQDVDAAVALIDGADTVYCWAVAF